jgi:hypothetical protein
MQLPHLLGMHVCSSYSNHGQTFPKLKKIFLVMEQIHTQATYFSYFGQVPIYIERTKKEMSNQTP